MRALADQVRAYVKNASDEAAVAFGVSAGIVGVMSGGTTAAADAPPGGGRRPAPKRKATVESAPASGESDDAAKFAASVREIPGGRKGDYFRTWDAKRRNSAATKARKAGLVRVDGDKGAARYYPIEAD